MDASTVNVTPSSSASASVPPSSQSPRLGWTEGSNNRGTMDIIWSCALTMFLCCWSVLVMNVPTPGSSSFHVLRQKFRLLCLCALAPEIVFQVALGQFLSANQSKAGFHAAGYTDWSLRHSFYVNMGAIHLRAPDFQKTFPIDAHQLLYLIRHQYVDYPKVNEDAIKDKNKSDGMLRLITLLQAIWFVVNLAARSKQDLAISCMELSTSAWVIFCLGITICWSKKPADVETVEFIVTKTPLQQILKDGGDKARAPYYNTPLDFISREEWVWSRLWNHGLTYLRACRLVSPAPERPIQHIGDTANPVVAGWWYALFVLISLCYFAVFIAAWNFNFPSKTERLLWRIASIAAPASATAFCFAMFFCATWYPLLRDKWQKSRSKKTAIHTLTQTPVVASSRQTHNSPAHNHFYFMRSLVRRAVRWFRNNSTSRDPELDCPLRLVFLTWFFGIVYCFSRGYIAVEDFMELRSLPASAYQTVEWTMLLPVHL